MNGKLAGNVSGIVQVTSYVLFELLCHDGLNISDLILAWEELGKICKRGDIRWSLKDE